MSDLDPNYANISSDRSPDIVTNIVDRSVKLLFRERPDASLWPKWGNKWCILNQQLKIPVALLVVYLEKGDRATFPDRYGVNVAGLTTQLRFTTVRLWEHRDRIESGELAELAP